MFMFFLVGGEVVFCCILPTTRSSKDPDFIGLTARDKKNIKSRASVFCNICFRSALSLSRLQMSF